MLFALIPGSGQYIKTSCVPEEANGQCTNITRLRDLKQIKCSKIENQFS